MGAKSKIEWTDATWEPVTGCTLASEGCRNCYAAELAAGRMKHHPSMAGLARRNAAGVAAFTGEVRFNEGWINQPLLWRRPQAIFVCSRGDLFHPAVPDAWIDMVFAIMALSPQHFFRVLTKRPARMRDYMSEMSTARSTGRGEALVELARKYHPDPEAVLYLEAYRWPLPNVGLGVSVEGQPTADERIPVLLDTPAAMRFVSAEPLLGPVNLTRVTHRDQKQFSWLSYDPTLNALTGNYPLLDGGPRRPHPRRLHEVIAGGESGRHARPMHPDWARSLRDQCAAAGTAFFFKQWGEWAPEGDDHGIAPDACYDREGRPVFASAVVGLSGEIERGAPYSFGSEFMRLCGKKAAGAMLDGREHLDVAPQVKAHFARIGRAA